MYGKLLSPLLLVAVLLSGAVAAATPPAAARTIVLVRHGHYSDDPAADAGLGPGLSVLGVAQARLAGARLAGQPFRFDRVVASPMTRAQDTAGVITSDLAGAAILTEPELAECTPPTRRTEVTQDTPVAEQKACAAKLDRMFAKYFATPEQPGHVLLVCHGNVIRYLITRAMGVDPKAWLEMSVGHASLTTILVEGDGRYKLIAAGDVGHLPPNLRTGATGDPERDLRVPQ